MPAPDSGVDLPTVYGFCAIVAVALGLASFGVTRALPDDRDVRDTARGHRRRRARRASVSDATATGRALRLVATTRDLIAVG